MVPSTSDHEDGLEDLLLEELEEEQNVTAGPPPLKKLKPAAEYCPPHPGYMGGICIRCGISKEEAEASEKKKTHGELSPRSEYFKGIRADGQQQEEAILSDGKGHLSLNYIHHGLEVSASEAERLRRYTAKKALDSKKLLLVLDLDHTLLHSTRMTDVSEKDAETLHGMLQSQSFDTPMLFHLGHMNMWTKFRPGVREFLEKAKESFDLHVFTMGDKSYAGEMAKLLDPTGKLFGGRVASSSDADSSMMKDLDVLLGSDDMMVILDDTVGVWPKHRANVIQIKRYLFFPACAVKFGAEGTSFMEIGGDEDDIEGALGCALDVLHKAHDLFFSTTSSLPKDIRDCLKSLRSTILKDCCILFTRIIPKGEDPQRHPAWVLATNLGATCVDDTSSRVTHVIAGGTTSKAEWAKKTGKYVVTIQWLYSCGFSWKRADESLFGPNTLRSTPSSFNQLCENETEAVNAAKAAAGRTSE